MKKVLKVIAVISAIAGVAAAVYFAVKKIADKKAANTGNTEENYVSCSCCDEEFISETVA